MNLIVTTLFAWWSKTKVAAAGLGIILLILTGAALYLLRAGKKLQQVTDLQNSLRATQKEYKDRAEIDALAASVARDRLLKRWSRH